LAPGIDIQVNYKIYFFSSICTLYFFAQHLKKLEVTSLGKAVVKDATLPVATPASLLFL
jgi:hypothetical protein